MQPAALEAIHHAFAEEIVYTPEGGGPAPISAIYCNDDAGDLSGQGGSTARRISFEIRYADIAARPTNRAIIEHKGVRRKVINVTDRDDVEAWQVVAERSNAS